ncbi:tetratricopeptide repeat protein [Melaminivora sp.]|uniref:tetratricopeptide repeat protein n=1 Tax=Melaminivora sp. TaxID=1933032 RepID=UPI0028A9EBE7|nr:tetratricopeptide repeat protein [Melaminivora sp.]
MSLLLQALQRNPGNAGKPLELEPMEPAGQPPAPPAPAAGDAGSGQGAGAQERLAAPEPGPAWTPSSAAPLELELPPLEPAPLPPSAPAAAPVPASTAAPGSEVTAPPAAPVPSAPQPMSAGQPAPPVAQRHAPEPSPSLQRPLPTPQEPPAPVSSAAPLSGTAGQPSGRQASSPSTNAAPADGAPPRAGTPPAASTQAARDAAQAMVAARAPALPPGARTRRLVWSLVAGLVLGAAAWLGWQYWQSLHPGSSLLPAQPAPLAELPPPADEALLNDAEPDEPAPLLAETPADPAAAPGGGEQAPVMPGAAPLPSVGPTAPAATAPAAEAPAARPRERRGENAKLQAERAAHTAALAAAAAAAPAPATGTSASPPSQVTGPAHTGRVAAPGQPAALVRSHAAQRLQEGWSALRQGDAPRAQALYQQVLAERPDDPDATLGLAVALHRQRQFEPAWAAYQRSLQLWPDNETARNGMLAILSESEPATAESRLQEWVQERPRDAAAQAALGALLGRQGRWSEALGALTLAQSLAPASAAHAYNLAVGLDQVRRYDDALRMYRQALQLGAAGTTARAAQRRMAELQELWQQ